MIYYDVLLNRFDWCVRCFITTDYDELHIVLEELRKLDCSERVLKKAHTILFEQINSGFAYSNLEERESIMVINLSTTMDEFINTYNHEKNHIEMHICQADDIDPYSEEAAVLSGELAEGLYSSMIKRFH